MSLLSLTSSHLKIITISGALVRVVNVRHSSGILAARPKALMGPAELQPSSHPCEPVHPAPPPAQYKTQGFPAVNLNVISLSLSSQLGFYGRLLQEGCLLEEWHGLFSLPLRTQFILSLLGLCCLCNIRAGPCCRALQFTKHPRKHLV